MAQTDKDKNTFLSKLARFVANPTTDWSALDKASQGQKGHAGGEGLELTQEEIFALRHQRRKDNRNIRIKEFAILRQIRAGASVPGALNANSDPSAGSSAGAGPVLFSAQAQAAAPLHSNIAADFRVSEIGRIEEQMAGQWWGTKGGVHAPTEAQKTQMLIETQIGEVDVEIESQDGDLIAFDPAFLAPQHAQPPSVAQPVPPVQRTEKLPVAPVHGSGEQVDFSENKKAAQQLATFVYRNAFSDLAEDDHGTAGAGNALPPEEGGRLQPLTQADAQSMAAAQAVQDELVADSDFPPAVLPPEYTPEDLPECLNEPAIRFVQGDNEQTETQLLQLAQAEQMAAQTGQAGEEPHISLALLDFYRCTGQEEKFEAASIQMVRHFDRSAPQYQGADLGEATRILSTLGSFHDIDYTLQNGWRCPAELDLTDVMLLRAQLIAQPAQVVLDWQALQTILDDAVEPLLDQFRDLAGRKVDLLMWGGERLLACCAQRIDALNGTGSPVYPLLWLLRLELVRIMHGQEEFDHLALEYCVALEESPPSWVRTRCHFIDAENALSMLERGEKENAAPQDATAGALSKDEEETLKHPLQWKGTLKGDIRNLLQAVGAASTGDFCIIDCSQLNSMDYQAAVTLLEWLMAPQNEQRHVQFVQVNRLLAVFWRVMGITAQATVKLRRD